MTKPRPEHGTPARYRGNRNVEGCRCNACRRAAVREEALCTLERLAGNPRRVPARPVFDWVQELRAAGLSDANIAEGAQLSYQSVLVRLAHQRTIGRDKAKALLAVPLDYRPNSAFVPALGAVRRVQAMCALGHSAGTIARRADTDRQRISKLALGLQIQINTDLDAAIRRVYPELINEPGTCRRALDAARRHGWHKPAAWDDIDDPTEQPGAVLALTGREAAEERLTEVLLLADAGALPQQIHDRVGLSVSRIHQLLDKHRPVLHRHLAAIAESKRGSNHKKKAA